MSGIIKTIKAKDEHDVQHNIFPKTVLEAVVDPETNETLDVILDELNDKIDNIEVTGGGGDASNKVSKTGDTMTGMLTVKDNVSVEGDLFVPIAPEQSFLNSETTNFTAPTSGGWQDNVSYLIQDMANSKTFLGSYSGAVDAEGHENYYHNVISVRHRNGRGDGNGFGMYLRSALTAPGSLCWNKQHGGNWEGEKVILDTDNYANYALPLTGGTVNGELQVSGRIITPSYGWFQSDYVIHAFANGQGSTGYSKFATLTTRGTYIGGYIRMTIDGRGQQGDLVIGFNGVDYDAGAAIAHFAQNGNLPQMYVVQTAPQTFDLYMEKHAWQYATVMRMNFPMYMRDRVAIAWCDVFSTSLPGGYHPARITNDWSGIVESTTPTISLSLRKGFNYIIFASGSSGMSLTETLIYVPSMDTFHILNTSAAGSGTSAISGTTYTLTFNGNSSSSSKLNYIEIGS